jgi:hypothetical protein
MSAHTRRIWGKSTSAHTGGERRTARLLLSEDAWQALDHDKQVLQKENLLPRTTI